MAAAKAKEIPNKIEIERSLLMLAETETIKERLQVKLVKDVNIQRKYANKPLVTKPLWPYDLWQTNFEDTDSEFRRQTRLSLPVIDSSEYQPSKIPNQDDGQSIIEPENRGEGSNSTELEVASLPEQDNIGLTDALQISDSILSILENMLSVSIDLDKLSQAKNDGISTESVAMETEFDSVENRDVVQTDHGYRLTVCETQTMVDKNCQLPSTAGPDRGSLDLMQCSEDASMEDFSLANQNVFKEVMERSISRSEECMSQPKNDPSGTKLSSKSDLMHDHFDMNRNMINTKTKSAEASERVIATSDCKEHQIRVEDTDQDIVDRNKNVVKKQDESFVMSKTHHFKTELKSPVSLKSLLYNSTKTWLPNISIDQLPQTKFIQEMASTLMNNTVVELSEKHQIFSKCYIIETGSMAEGTKIYRPDEFDFNVALPILADPEVAELFYVQMGIKVRLHHHFCSEIISFLQQFSFYDSSHRHLLINAYLLQVFRETMKDHISEGWAMREESNLHMMRVFLKNQTLTVHLQCNDHGPYPGFILSIDVCFGIPLDAERLDSIYVPDLHHATNISFIRDECLRMKTGVIAVISRNPLVAERFFFKTEPYRFHSNKQVADCYKLAKHVARTFLPKIVKNNCILCEDTLIPSFYMKTVVSFMMDIYTESSFWSDSELVNRLVEIFEILSYSFVHGKFRTLAYYSYINSMYLDCNLRYIPETGSINAGVGLDAEKPCTIPSIEDVNLTSSPVGVTSAIQRYWRFMEYEEWTIGVLLGKLTELLYFIKFTETDSI